MTGPLPAARSLFAAVGRARAQPLKALAFALDASPAPVRRVAGRLLIAVGTPSGHGAAVRVLGMTAMGRRDAALGWAEAQAAKAEASVATRIALARAALAVRGTPTVARVLGTLPPTAETRPEVLALRADLALLTGRYAEAAALAVDPPVPFRWGYNLLQGTGALVGWLWGADVGPGTLLVVVALGPAVSALRARLPRWETPATL